MLLLNITSIQLQGSDMGASPGYTPKRYLPTLVPRAPAPKRYLPPRNVGDGGHQVNRRICDPDCDASGKYIVLVIYESKICLSV